MFKRGTVVLVAAVVVVGLLAAPAVGAANISDVDAEDFTFDVSASSTATHDIQVTNSGENGTTADVTIDDTPAGVGVSGGGETLAPGSTTDVTLDINAGTNPESGTVSGDVNGEPFDFYLTVAPQPGFEDEPADLGDVLVGQRASGSIDVEEVTGEGSLDGVDISVSGESQGTLDFTGQRSVTGSGGTIDWDVTADSDVPQHETLEWTVSLTDGGASGETREVDVEARVIYPGYFGEPDIDGDEFVFDEPRNAGSTLTRTVELDIPNDGDTPIEVGEVSASSSNSGVSVRAMSTPNEIEGQSTAEVDLRITADRDLPEGDYDISATVRSADYNDEASVDETFEIVHETSLVADDAAIGDVAIGEANSRTVTISEELGYKDVNDVETTLTDGPEQWLTLESAPSRVRAGSSEQASFTLDFDTSAELGESYQWVYTVEGDEDDATITVTASPVPLDLEPIRNELSDYDTPVADSTLELVDTMDERLRSGESGDEEISTVLTFGEAATLYIDAVNEARTHLDNDEHDEAQSAIIRAAAAYNTMGLQANRLENAEVRGLASAAQSDAEGTLDGVIDEQQAYYESRLESGEMSLIEEATTQRQLSRIALLQGDQERANELEAEATAAFNNYSNSVSTGEQAVQDAESTWSEMEEDQFVVVLGQPLLLNPANYDAFVAGTESIDAAYQEAISAFESAGETARAEEVTAEYESRTAALGTARYSLFGAIGAYALIAIGVTVRTARRMFWYVRDTRESVSGDFLV